MPNGTNEILAHESTVRIILLDPNGRVLLQRIEIAEKKPFYITPGGRVDTGDPSLIAAAKRELLEETGIPDAIFQCQQPFFTGSQTLRRNDRDTKLTENFFIATLSESHTIRSEDLCLTEDEKRVLTKQSWFSVSDIASCKDIIFPVNIQELLEAVLEGRELPAVDLSNPADL